MISEMEPRQVACGKVVEEGESAAGENRSSVIVANGMLRNLADSRRKKRRATRHQILRDGSERMFNNLANLKRNSFD